MHYSVTASIQRHDDGSMSAGGACRTLRQSIAYSIGVPVNIVDRRQPRRLQGLRLLRQLAAMSGVMDIHHGRPRSERQLTCVVLMRPVTRLIAQRRLRLVSSAGR